jgi:hypothetical protein
MPISTREGLKDYALRRLGAPVVEINVADEQLEDRIDEALEYFNIYHWDGSERAYLMHKVTNSDLTNKYIPINDNVFGISKVYSIYSGSSTSKNIFDLQYQLRLNDLYDLTSTSVVYFTTVMGHLQMLDTILNGMPLYRFNRLTNRLYIDINWGVNVKVDDYLMIDTYKAIDPASFARVWNENWLKKYTTVLFKEQWGTNLKKFSGLTLPGGVTLDGDKLYAEAIEEKKELEEELTGKSAPLEFFVG